LPEQSGTSSDGKPIYSVQQAAQQLTRDGYSWNAPSVVGAGVRLTYAFRATEPLEMPEDTKDFSLFSAAQIVGAERALTAWSDVANITFTRVNGDNGFSDNAQILFAKGNSLTLSYRGTEFKRMSERNRHALLRMEARGEIKILLNSHILRVDDDIGRPRVFFTEGDLSGTYDRVVYALGGSTPTNFLRMLGISFDESGPKFDESGMTNVPGLFLIGDLVLGRTGGSIMTAFNSAKRAMNRICARLLNCHPEE
jgi:hypothetical protein